MPVVGLITHMAKLVHTTILVGQWDDIYSNPNNLGLPWFARKITHLEYVCIVYTPLFIFFFDYGWLRFTPFHAKGLILHFDSSLPNHSIQPAGVDGVPAECLTFSAWKGSRGGTTACLRLFVAPLQFSSTRNHSLNWKHLQTHLYLPNT